MTDTQIRKAQQVAKALQQRGHHQAAAYIENALGHSGAALLHALREACQVALTAIEAIDPVSATMIDELRLEVDKHLNTPDERL
jgi:hypothetical protein